jgi:hypothetical protein
MPAVVVHHRVKDKAAWLASTQRAEFFETLGVKNIRTFVNPQDSTSVGVVMDVPDLKAVMTALKTKAAADAMAHDGVLPETVVILVEESNLF